MSGYDVQLCQAGRFGLALGAAHFRVSSEYAFGSWVVFGMSVFGMSVFGMSVFGMNV